MSVAREVWLAKRTRPPLAAMSFGLAGGPVAWFIQLCIGYALATWPCFPQDERIGSPLAGSEWTRFALPGTLIAAVVIALAAFAVARRAFVTVAHEAHAGELLEVGKGRTRFLAFWGMALSAGFAVATSLTAVAFVVLPRCGG